MALDSNSIGDVDDTIVRSLSDISDQGSIIRVSIDLVAATRRHLSFLRSVAQSQWLHHTSTLLQSIRRYDELWMPLISDLTMVGSTPPILQPPLDIQWVWYCHTLNPVSYRKYCESRFSKILQKSMIFDDENEEYAMNRCIDIWSRRYPSEPFLLEPISDAKEEIVTNDLLFSEVSKHKSLCSKFFEPYMSEMIYLIAAKQRYRGFLYLLQRFRDVCSRFVPTLDIQLMWLTHQSYPVIYAEDVKDVEGDLGKVIGVWDTAREEDVTATKALWEKMWAEPYEKAGATLDDRMLDSSKPLAFLDIWEGDDVNTKYKSMEPRFLLEVCVFVRGITETKDTPEKKHEFIRLRTVRCHRELKIDKPITSVPSQTWQKTWHLYCEFGTKGVVLELRKPGGRCFNRNTSRSTIVFLWNELLRAPSLTLGRELGQQVRAVASITPPIQVGYLLKCVADRVTDDSGAMISDVILRMNRYRPQEGRWLSRTVLDHAGRECFILRIRVGCGFWRRGGETPATVKWVDRIIEVREGSWSYVVGSIGRAPEKVVGTATPKEEESRDNRASWSLSTGDELTIHWDSSGLTFHLQNQASFDSVRLLKGRKMQYQVNEVSSEEEEMGFLTIVRYTPENPNGRATALMNWRLLVVELLPEEDAVLVLLVCMAILRSVSEMESKDVGSLLVRRRLKEPKLGMRDWGSVILHPSSSSTSSSPHLQPWYMNAKVVMASLEADSTRQSNFNYSPAEGGDKLYKRGIIPRA